MPVRITKTDGYRVSHGEKVSAKSTTKEKAESQRRLLEGIRHGWKPTGKLAVYKRKKKGSREKYKEFIKGRSQ